LNLINYKLLKVKCEEELAETEALIHDIKNQLRNLEKGIEHMPGVPGMGATNFDKVVVKGGSPKGLDEVVCKYLDKVEELKSALEHLERKREVLLIALSRL
jgi:hypothetical protein